MGIALLEALLGCVHRNKTFPQTPVRRAGTDTQSQHTYVACLDCGKVLPYDWDNMREIEQESGRRANGIKRAVSWVRFIAAS